MWLLSLDPQVSLCQCFNLTGPAFLSRIDLKWRWVLMYDELTSPKIWSSSPSNIFGRCPKSPNPDSVWHFAGWLRLAARSILMILQGHKVELTLIWSDMSVEQAGKQQTTGSMPFFVCKHDLQFQLPYDSIASLQSKILGQQFFSDNANKLQKGVWAEEWVNGNLMIARKVN